MNPITEAGLTLHDYEMALESQSACNLSGIVKTLAETMDRIWEEARKEQKGTDWVGHHPICRLYAEQIAHLSGAGTTGNGDSYHEAVKAVEAVIAKFKQSAKA